MKNKWLLYGLYVVVIALLVYVAYITNGFGLMKQKAPDGNSKDGQWQAVFLTNGQVYFGELSGVNSKYATLTNIYYLQVQSQVQPADTTSTDNSKVTLVKLGNELHAPQDQMKIATDQILFYENLKKDGKVVQAIDNYIKNGSK